jgi:type IV pilus assembly protein PilY1
MKTICKLTLNLVLAFGALFGALQASATDILRAPIQTNGSAKPNVIFGMDDSGSMDFETLLNTNDGMLWWETSSQSAWDRTGQPSFSGSDSKPMAYLFPNGCATPGATRHLCDAQGYTAVPPTYQFASLRSSSYNPLYYNPATTYNPWSTATVSGTLKTFSNASPTAASSHPLYAGSTMDLTAVQTLTATDTTYEMFAGMVIPAGAKIKSGGSFVDPSTLSGKSKFSLPHTLASSEQYTASIPYYPATYWVKATCTVDNVACTAAPDGATLKRYEIKSGNTFPSGRTYADELQNFANWFTYYRKRKLMLSGSMGSVLDTLNGMRLGVVPFNNRATPTMYDTDSTDPAQNGQKVAGIFAGNAASGGTPTRETLNYIGNQFSTNKAIIQYSCQRNAAFIVTDGFAAASNVTPPTYDNKVWGKTAPYTTTYSKTLADIALSYYTNNLRTDLTTGRVPAATESLDPAADKNPNLHMNTYGITLGAKGAIWPANTTPYTQTPKWTNPSTDGSPDSIDDLFHATINGRGSMFLATTPQETANNIQAALAQILRLSGSQSGVTYSTVNLRAGNSMAFAGSYKFIGWSGDLESFAVDPLTGTLAANSNWSANKMLQSADWTTRKLVTYNGSGVSFGTASTGASSAVVSYLRGSRASEGSTYRLRTGLLGAVINADAAASPEDGVVYGATNEGFVHAFDMSTGSELWAYAPSFGISAIVASSSPSWTFVTILDGTPVLGKVGSRKVLVGGRGTAGSGYYALDVTSPKADTSESDTAARVLWEFPNSATSANVRSSLGTSIGRPVFVKTTQWGDVVLVTSGYNSTLDGKGRLFVLDALTGAVRATLVTSTGTLAADAGLGQVSGWLEADGTVQFVYGGDERGNLWRFDLVNSTVMKLATLTNSGGTAMPITDAPELSKVGSRRMVFVGTGRLLGTSDLDDTATYSFFGIWDNNTALTNVRTQLAARTVTVNADGTRSVSGSDVVWTTQRGWFVDLPAGEKVNTDPAVAYGAVAFTTNKASAAGCTSNSALYLASTASGLQLPDTAFATPPYFGVQYATTLASRPTVARTSSGKTVVTTRQSDGTTNTRLLTLTSSNPAQKLSWRQILR